MAGICMISEWFPAKQTDIAQGIYRGWGNFESRFDFIHCYEHPFIPSILRINLEAFSRENGADYGGNNLSDLCYFNRHLGNTDLENMASKQAYIYATSART